MVLQVNNITKTYKNNRGAIDISFEIDNGEVFGLLGPNGSGKTTVMKAITGLIKPKFGDIKIFGYDVAEQTQKALEDVGALIEAPAIISYMTAYENIKLVSRFYKNHRDIDEVLEVVGLGKYKKEKVSKFSLGMKQRMGIALAIVGNPKLIVFDEPTNGLDIEGIVEIRTMIINLAKTQKVTVVVSSHLSQELQQICTKVGIMKDSKLLEISKMDYVLENYSSLEDYFLAVVQKSRGAMANAN